MAEPTAYYDTLPDLTEDQLREKLREPGYQVSKSDYLAELDRRRSANQTQRIVNLTEDVRRLTAQVRTLTIAAVVIAAIALAIALYPAVTAGGSEARSASESIAIDVLERLEQRKADVEGAVLDNCVAIVSALSELRIEGGITNPYDRPALACAGTTLP